VAVLARRGRVQHDAQVAVQLPGGCLQICSDTQADTMRMAGPATFVFEGEWL
jgi:diaminopimelate epimerase